MTAKMPTNRNLTVSIISGDSTSTPYPEYGKQHTKNYNTSCYIQSSPGASFRVSITPEPYMIQRNPKWHLLATMRLDGKEKFEKRMFVWLDPKCKWIKDGGQVEMDGRAMRDGEGRMRLHKWVFQEIGGIDRLLDDLTLDFSGSCQSDEEEAHLPNGAGEEDDLVSALQGLGANRLQDKEETSKAGMIEITFQRITLGESKREYWTAEDAEEDCENVRVKDKNIMHTTGREYLHLLPSKTNFVTYHLYDDEIYANFKFFYRSEDVLRKYGFPGLPAPAVKPMTVDSLPLRINFSLKRPVGNTEEGSPGRKKLGTQELFATRDKKDRPRSILYQSDPDDEDPDNENPDGNSSDEEVLEKRFLKEDRKNGFARPSPKWNRKAVEHDRLKHEAAIANIAMNTMLPAEDDDEVF